MIRSGLYIVPYFCFALLLVQTAFAYPAAEDLAVHYYDGVLGMGNYIGQFYHESSRYVSYPLLFVLLNGRFFMEHYFLVPLGLLLGVWGALFLVIRTMTGMLFADRAGNGRVAWWATTVLVSLVSVLFEPASVVYWVSGSMIYFFSFLLFLLLLALLFRMIARGRASAAAWIGILGLTVAVAGTNEIALFFLGITLCWTQLIFRELTGRWLWPVNACLAAMVLCVCVVILPGGAVNRAGHFGFHHSGWQGLGVAIGYTGRMWLRMFTSPLLWLCLVLAAAAGSVTRGDLRIRLAASRWLHPLVCLVPAVIGVAGFYFLIYVFSGELLPPRAGGMIELFVFLFLLAAAYSYGTRLKDVEALRPVVRREPLALIFGLLLFLGSHLLPQAVEDLVTGVVYRKIMVQRKEKMLAARERGERTVGLSNYAADYDTVVMHSAPVFIRRNLLRRGAVYPRLVFYRDPLADTVLYIHYYAEYYGMDTIRYEGRAYHRVGLIQREVRP